jgi:hypothetical protein
MRPPLDWPMHIYHVTGINPLTGRVVDVQIAADSAADASAKGTECGLDRVSCSETECRSREDAELPDRPSRVGHP